MEIDFMNGAIFCEGALYGVDGRELAHPAYKRKTIKVSVQWGFHGEVAWEGLRGAADRISTFRLLILDKVLAEKIAYFGVGADGDRDGRVYVELNIPGKAEGRPS